MKFGERTVLFLATGAFIGYIPLAPGTLGSLWGLPIYWFLSKASLTIVIVSTLVLIAGLLAAIAGFLYWFLTCPCERTPGGFLLGEESQETISDWSFVNDVPLCQIQTRVFFLPHSINLNCSAIDGELFIGCMNCEGM